jgi:hypothetical protein
MKNTPSFTQWLFKDKTHSNLRKLITMYFFITFIVVGSFISLSDTDEPYWAIIIGLFSGIMYGVTLMLPLSIYIRLLRIGYFNKK